MSTASANLIPKDFCRVQLFQCREIHRQLESGEWELADDLSTEPLQLQLDEWATKTRNKIVSASAPHTDVMFLDDEKRLKCFLTGVSVCYVPAVETPIVETQKNEPKPTASPERPRLTPPTRKAP